MNMLKDDMIMPETYRDLSMFGVNIGKQNKVVKETIQDKIYKLIIKKQYMPIHIICMCIKKIDGTIGVIESEPFTLKRNRINIPILEKKVFISSGRFDFSDFSKSSQRSYTKAAITKFAEDICGHPFHLLYDVVMENYNFEGTIIINTSYKDIIRKQYEDFKSNCLRKKLQDTLQETIDKIKERLGELDITKKEIHELEQYRNLLSIDSNDEVIVTAIRSV